MKKIIIMILLFPFICRAQSINFEKDMNWKELQGKVKAENKYVFVDIYATWCGPCHFLADSIFSKSEVAQYVNAHFVSYQVQIDKTANDIPEVKAKYEEAMELARQYKVEALPTLLILSPDGELLKKIEGGFPDANSFLGAMKKVIDPQEQYFSLLEKYYGGEKGKPFLTKLLALARQVKDQKLTDELIKKLNE